MTRHGSIRLVESNCTSCMICARECPTWCISIDSHSEPVPDLPAGARPRKEHVLDRFAVDWSLCMYCGICIEECPFDALEWADPVTPAGQSMVEEMLAPPPRREITYPANLTRSAPARGQWGVSA